MEIRIGELVLSVNLLFLAAGYGYFLTASQRALFPHVTESPRESLAVLCAATIGGVLGALAYGQVGPLLNLPPGPGITLPTRTNLVFGSFGGYWGVLCGVGMYCVALRRDPWPYLDAVTPGMLLGGAIARIADAITGAVHGIGWKIAGFHPFTRWALYDIVAHLVIFGLIVRTPRPSIGERSNANRLVIFLCGYGCLRFIIEFARDTPRPLGPLTIGQGFALLQALAGIAIIALLRNSQRTSDAARRKKV